MYYSQLYIFRNYKYMIITVPLNTMTPIYLRPAYTLHPAYTTQVSEKEDILDSLTQSLYFS